MRQKNKYIFLICTVLFSFYSLKGNVTNILSYKIEWNKVPSFKQLNDNTIKEYIGFKNAIVNNDLIPVFYQKFYINREIEKVNFIEPVYEKISEEQIKYFPVSAIKDSIEFSYYINSISSTDYFNISLIPLRRNSENGNFEKLISFRVKITFLKDKLLKNMNTSRYPENSVLNTGKWYKMKVSKTGMYTLSYDDIIKLGFSKPENIGIYGLEGGMLPEINNGSTYTDLKEINVKFFKGGDGIFNSGDYMIFYLKGPDKWSYSSQKGKFLHEKHNYSYYAYYFISNIKSAKEIENQTAPSASPNYFVNTFEDFAFHEIDTFNLIESGREWYGEKFTNIGLLSHSLNFTFPNIVKNEPVSLSAVVLSHAEISTSFTFTVNNTNIGTYSLGGLSNLNSITSQYAVEKYIENSFNVNNDNINIIIKYNNSNSYSSEGYLDYVNLNVKRDLVMSGNQMSFRNIECTDSGNVSEFTISNINSNLIVWDVTDFYNTKSISGNVTGNNYIFKANTDSLKEFIAFYPSNLIKPTLTGDDVGLINNQNLHGLEPPDYIIITHNKFMKYAKELAEFHRNNSGLDVIVIDQDQIFNEFSSGTRDIAAIRNFLKMFYDRSGREKPRYLLLFGDGTYDNKHFNENNYNFIMTYQSVNSILPTLSYVSDDYYGLLDDNEEIIKGGLDCGIGRLPVSDTTTAAVAVNKIKEYLSNDTYGDWRNTICFVGDDEDHGLHMTQANDLSIKVKEMKPTFNINKIFLDAYKQISTATGARYPAVNTAIFNQLKKGTLIFNYTGHGAEFGLAHEKILSDDDINNWSNWGKFPVFMTATCEFSRYDKVTIQSGQYTIYKTTGENVVLYENGGAIASLTTTRIVYATDNYELNENFYDYVFEKNTLYNERNRLGDIMKLSKNATSATINKRNFSLLGDPAIILSYPEHGIVIDSINGKLKTEMTDTLGAFSYVNITGHIERNTGGLFNDFNGLIYTTIFDKEENITTLDNDKEGAFQFKLQNNVLFKGKASVINGYFNFSFIIPKDISFNKGKGKISCYAENGETDASGCDSTLIIGGVDLSNELDDLTGPDIKMYMNDELYKENGITNESPTLLAVLSDESGINTSTSGIGHEMIAIIDNNYMEPIVMNDFYQSETDDFKNGKITYPLLNLDPGEHTINIKVWDIVNNSSQAEMSFIVRESNKLVLQNVYNYPNPFANFTNFAIEHNLAGDLLEITINIYNMSGQLVTTLYNEGSFDGYMSPVIQWDGRSNTGCLLEDGFYFYRIKVKSEKGSAEKSSKMMILR